MTDVDALTPVTTAHATTRGVGTRPPPQHKTSVHVAASANTLAMTAAGHARGARMISTPTKGALDTTLRTTRATVKLALRLE